MRKDIQNRSVYYSDREPVDGDRTFDLIVRDTERNLHSHSSNTTAASLERNTSTCSDTRGAEGGDLVLNNVRLNLDSQMYPGAGEAEKPPKNVNLNNVRCDAGPSQEPFPDDPWFHDVNFYLKDGDCDKSNLNPRYHQAKVAKADLDVMIRNILEDDDCKEKDDDQDDKDSVHNLKLSLSKKNNLS